MTYISIERVKETHGHQLDTIYQLAQTFFSEKSDKAFHLNFDDRIALSALAFQVKYGRFDEGKTEIPGFFDFIGKRRIAEWKALGDLKQDDAKWEFVTRLHNLCPVFLSYLDAYFRQINQDATVHLTAISPTLVTTTHSTMPSSMEEVTVFIQQNESDIRTALNGQTHDQFELYAMQHYPQDVSKREALIAELQQRHFHEYVAYIRQRYALTQSDHQPHKPIDPNTPQNLMLSRDSPGMAMQQQLGVVKHTTALSISASSQPIDNNEPTEATESPVVSTMDISHISSTSSSTTVSECTNSNGFVIPSGSEIPAPTNLDTSGSSFPNKIPVEHVGGSDNLVHTPSMWTRDEVKEFRQNLSNTKDAVVQVGCGEVITIRVPAYPSGTSIMWEFATDDYDIGFGLYFEWAAEVDTSTGQTTVSVTETAPTDNTPANTQPPLVDEIIPIYRRNSHQEVYCGAHDYPGPGTYLFKFDNSYSLWRSKVLYYRVYYTC